MTEFLSTGDRRIAGIAGRQHGVVTVEQLAEAGIDKDGVAWRVRAGRLHRLHRGVYAVGHRSLSSSKVTARDGRAPFSHARGP
jgi:predicted transcriptional regulator of viral defense system